jgi:prepilin-type N-terminal cleavage/methylation domain-containing protein
MRQTGFTLIEVLVALVILGAGLAVIVAGLHIGVTSAKVAAQDGRSLAIAESLLAEQGTATKLQYGTAQGVTADGFSWQIITAPWAENPAGGSRLIGGYRINVDVSFAGRHVRLATLRAGPAIAG